MRVLILGGGEKAVKLLDTLSRLRGVDILGLYDTTKNSPGFKRATELKLKASTNLADFITENDAAIIIETSGSKEFQKILSKIVPDSSRLVDSKAAELIINIAEESEKTKRYDQLGLIAKLSDIFSSGYDTYNIVRPVYDLLKSVFDVDVEAVLIFYRTTDELMIASDHDVDDKTAEEILNHISRDDRRDKPQIFTQRLSKNAPKLPPLKSFIMIPLSTKIEEEGILVLASTKKDAFLPEDKIVLNILADEFALFIGNEKVKKDLADAKSKVESMVHSMSEGVIAINNKQEVILLNPAAKILLGLKEIRFGRPLWESLDNKDVLDLLKEITLKESIVTKEVFFTTGKEDRIIKFFTAPSSDGMSKKTGWIMLLTDISKEKEVDRMKSEFISTTSHELRTPLAAIKESVMLMADGTTGETTEAQNRFLTIAVRNIERLATLINDLLDISKIETGRMILRKSSHDIPNIIDDVIGSISLLIKESKIELKTAFSGKIPPVPCDKDRITQVLINLVGNAIKFTPVGGMITVACAAGDKSVQVIVSDTGVGIDEKDISKLFKRFSQIDGSLTRRPGGTGLGLAISKELIEMHGGKIWVESRLGEGSKFTFILPMEAP